MRAIRLAAALVTTLQASGCTGPAPADAPLAVTNVAVIDGTGAPARSGQAVVVVAGRIAAVGPSASTAVPRGARRIDGRGRWLISGLWDMHVHAFANDFPDFAAPLLLAHGVTGARDMGFYVDSARFWTGEVLARRVMGPRMVVGGRLDGPDNRAGWVARAATADEARRAVDSLAAVGADFIKVYSRLPRDAYFAAADQARRRGIRVAGHVPHGVSMLEAAGQQDGIEHTDDLMRACSSEDAALRRELAEAPPDASPARQLATIRDHARRMRATYNPARCAAVWDSLAHAGTYLTPTLAVYQPYMAPGDTSVMHPSAHRYVPGPLLAQWRTRLQRAGPGDTSTVSAFFSLERTGEMHRAGVRLLAGTDAPLAYLLPGLSLHDELALLVRAGLTPMEALRTATYNPASYLGALDSLGTIRPGRLADLVLLDADPLSDIRNTRRIHTVIANGRVVDRAALFARAEAHARRSGHGTRR